MEVSVFELVEILNNVVSHREYIKLLYILMCSIFIDLRVGASYVLFFFMQDLTSKQMASALRQDALLSVCWMYPL